MASRHPITFGLKTSQIRSTYQEILDVWRDADESEAFADAWLWDHMLPLRGDVRDPALEAWTLLSALAARTQRLRLGVIVTDNRLRAPALLAKMAATVDQVSGGRLVFGLGVGGSAVPDPDGQALVRREFGAYGFDVVSPGEAVGAFGEAVEIVKRLWTETEPFDFDGRHYHLTAAVGEPKPVQRPHPPIMLAAAGQRSIAIAARHADMWVFAGDLDSFRSRSRMLDDECRAIGRDPSEIRRSTQFLVRTETVAETRDQVRQFIDAGADHVVLGAIPPYPGPQVRWLVEEVIEPVRSALGAGGIDG